MKFMDIVFEMQKSEHVATFQKLCGIVPIVDGKICRKTDCTSHKIYLTNNSKATKNGFIHESGEERELNHPNGHLNGSIYDKERNSKLRNGKTDLQNATKNDSDSNESHSDSHTPVSSNIDHTHVTYEARYKLVHYLFMLASILGDEPFYLSFYPLFGWNADFYLTRVTAVLWCLVMYVGQAAKDVILWPRPSYPPVVNLETHYILEYGMPSTHAMAGTAMPFTLLYFISSRYDMSPALLLWVAIPWCVLVCTSRLYVGVHSIADIVAGVIASAIMMLLLLPYLNAFDHFQQTHPAAPFVLLILAVLLCTKLYPPGAQTAKPASSKIVSIVYGMTLGVWLNYNLGIVKMSDSTAPREVLYPTISWAMLSVLRLVIGTTIISVSKKALKTLYRKVVCKVLGFSREEAVNENSTSIFVIYAILGVIISHVIPIVFYILHIDRVGFYTEGS